MNISVLKNKRELHVPADATVEELLHILCKWSPIIANDDNRTAFTLVKTPVQNANPKTSKDDIFSDMFGKDNGFNDIFSGIFGKK